MVVKSYNILNTELSKNVHDVGNFFFHLKHAEIVIHVSNMPHKNFVKVLKKSCYSWLKESSMKNDDGTFYCKKNSNSKSLSLTYSKAKSRTNWDKISLKLVYEFAHKATFISLGANWGRFQNFVKQEFISTLSITWACILPCIIVSPYVCLVMVSLF